MDELSNIIKKMQEAGQITIEEVSNPTIPYPDVEYVDLGVN